MNEITPIHILISDQFPTSHLLRFLVSQNYLSFFFCGGGGGNCKEFLEYFINFDNFFINIRHYIAITLQVAY